MNKFKGNNGISLLEIMVSMGILGMILLPVLMTFSTGNKNMMITETEFRAHTAALEIMEQTVSLPFKLIPVGKFDSEQIKGKDGEESLAVPFNISDIPDFKPALEISEIKKNNVVRFKKISLTMSFPAAKTDKRERKIELKTLVANEENQ